jgi:hypothetical protein
MTNLALLVVILATSVLMWLGRPLICVGPQRLRIVPIQAAACHPAARSPPG